MSSQLPPARAGRLVAWGNAYLTGRASLDDAADQVAGADAWHRVDGLASGDDISLAVALGRLAGVGCVGFRLALPVPGDVSGLPGPLDFNVEALAAGEAVLLDGLAAGLVPTVARLGGRAPHDDSAVVVRWRLLAASAHMGAVPGLADADRALAAAVREATVALGGLDVAGMDPTTAASLSALRSQPSRSADLAPGYSDRARDVLQRARWLLAVLALAQDETGSAVSASEIAARDSQLMDVGRAARSAIVAAHNSTRETSGEGAGRPR